MVLKLTVLSIIYFFGNCWYSHSTQVLYIDGSISSIEALLWFATKNSYLQQMYCPFNNSRPTCMQFEASKVFVDAVRPTANHSNVFRICDQTVVVRYDSLLFYDPAMTRFLKTDSESLNLYFLKNISSSPVYDF